MGTPSPHVSIFCAGFNDVAVAVTTDGKVNVDHVCSMVGGGASPQEFLGLLEASDAGHVFLLEPGEFAGTYVTFDLAERMFCRYLSSKPGCGPVLVFLATSVFPTSAGPSAAVRRGADREFEVLKPHLLGELGACVERRVGVAGVRFDAGVLDKLVRKYLEAYRPPGKTGDFQGIVMHPWEQPSTSCTRVLVDLLCWCEHRRLQELHIASVVCFCVRMERLLRVLYDGPGDRVRHCIDIFSTKEFLRAFRVFGTELFLHL